MIKAVFRLQLSNDVTSRLEPHLSNIFSRFHVYPIVLNIIRRKRINHSEHRTRNLAIATHCIVT